MLLVTIYIWLLFVVVFIAVLFPALVFVISLFDEKHRAGKMSYWLIVTVLLSSLIPLVGHSIIPYSVLNIIWRIVLGIIILIGFVPCIKYSNKNIHFLIAFLLTILQAVVPFIYYGSLIPDKEIPFTAFLTGNYPLSIFLVCIPLLIIGIIVGYVLKPSYKIRDVSFGGVSKGLPNEVLIQVKTRLDMFSAKLDNQINNLSAAIERFSVNMLLAKYPSNDTIKITDHKIGSLLSRLSDDIALIKTHIGQFKVKEINDDQEVLVRELSHFMATPLATIDASIKNLAVTVKTKDEDKLEENVNRIISAVSICNGILSTYREIFAQGVIANSGNLRTMITSSFDIFNNKEGKELKLQLNINDSYEGIGNYYVLSTILPILSNAVTASRPKSSVEVHEKNGIIRISNTFVGEIDLSNFDKEGYSSKENHRGMGLFTVRHLLARRKLGTLCYFIQNKRIYFDIPIIPQREKNAN